MNTNGQASAVNGRLPDEASAGIGQASGAWVRLAELYPTLDADPRTVRRWVSRNVPADGQERRPGPDGGCAEVYLRPDYLAPLRAAYGNGQSIGGHRVVNGQTPDKPPAGIGDHRADDPGWSVALAEAHARLADVVAERDRLRSQLDTANVALQDALRRGEEEGRARSAAEQRLASLRAAWWRWYALARRPWWRLRRLPEPPAELCADRLLERSE